MGRKRAPGNEWMPKGVFFRPSGYYWKPGGSTENIAPADATKAEVWVAYEKKVEGRKNRITFTQLWRKFLASADYADLAPRTQKDYLAHEKYILAVFGDAEAKAIKPEHIRRYMDARGQKAVSRRIMNTALCRAYFVGVINVVMFLVILALVWISFLSLNAIDILPMKSTERYIITQRQPSGLQWK